MLFIRGSIVYATNPSFAYIVPLNIVSGYIDFSQNVFFFFLSLGVRNFDDSAHGDTGHCGSVHLLVSP